MCQFPRNSRSSSRKDNFPKDNWGCLWEQASLSPVSSARRGPAARPGRCARGPPLSRGLRAAAPLQRPALKRPRRLLTPAGPGQTPRGAEVLTQWVWAGPRVGVSSQFSGDADGAGPRAALRGRGPAGRRERRGDSAPGSRRLRPRGEPTAGGIQTLGPGRGRSGAAGAGRERELGALRLRAPPRRGAGGGGRAGGCSGRGSGGAAWCGGNPPGEWRPEPPPATRGAPGASPPAVPPAPRAPARLPRPPAPPARQEEPGSPTRRDKGAVRGPMFPPGRPRRLRPCLSGPPRPFRSAGPPPARAGRGGGPGAHPRPAGHRPLHPELLSPAHATSPASGSPCVKQLGCPGDGFWVPSSSREP